MFSFRRKPKQEPESPRIPTSPSLPELSSQGIPWPEDLVDIAAIREDPPPDAAPTQGAAKTSFQGQAPILFHKPFRPSTGSAQDGGTISSLYMSGPPPAFDKKILPPVGRYSQRRARIPPTFNLMVSFFDAKHFPFHLDVKTRALILMDNRLWVAKELGKPHFSGCCWKPRTLLLGQRRTRRRLWTSF